MAKVYVEFYRECMRDANGHPIAVPKEPAIERLVLDTSSGADHSDPAPEGATMVAIATDGIVSIAVGKDAEATIEHRRRAANQTEYLGIQPGHRVSAITNT